MRTFIIHRKTGKAIEIEALSYTEDQEKDRIYFHRSDDKSDKDRFCILSAVIGIDQREPFVSGDVTLQRFLDSPNSEGYLRDLLRMIEDRKKANEAKKA